ncbi:hypothetical protein EST38_g4394 [Candolleomyces aberdarensis]|uniref:Uncharacterized protein n=1 Tax=Candolleomyces aberdarensis TaxID=2316362 RepID=A0A4Q2DN31_9AGAR|nr:hypothetical protein EST38_g4394 [Candolleomyces aberdarensis]
MALLLSMDNLVTLAVYEVQIDDHPKPVHFTHLGTFTMNRGGSTIGHFKINGDRVLADLERRVMVWDLVSRRYYIIRIRSTYIGISLSPIHFFGDFVVQVGYAFPTYIPEAVDMTAHVALEMPQPATTSLPLSLHFPEADFSKVSFPTLWDGYEDSPLFPIVYNVMKTDRWAPSGHVKLSSQYKLDVFREASIDEANPGHLKYTVDQLATLNIGDGLCATLEYDTYAYAVDGSQVIPAPCPFVRAYASDPYKLFLPSFAPDSMDIAELKRAVFGHYRWTHLIKRYSLPSERLGRGWEYVQPVSTSRVGYGGQLIAQFLVPGGRFLFVNTSDDVRVYVKLWDLGSAGRPPLESPILVSSFESQPREKSMKQWDICDAGGGKLRMALLLSMDNLMSLAVYEVQIDSHPEPVTFTHLGSFTVDRRSTIMHFKINGDRVLVHFDRRLVVWDMVSRRYYSIRTWPTSEELTLTRIHFVGDYVVQVGYEFPTAAEVVNILAHLALDMPQFATTSLPLSLQVPEEDASNVSFPPLWNGCGDSPLFPIVYNVIKTYKGEQSDYVKLVSQYKLDIFREAEANPGQLKYTVDQLATLDIGEGLSYQLLAPW